MSDLISYVLCSHTPHQAKLRGRIFDKYRKFSSVAVNYYKETKINFRVTAKTNEILHTYVIICMPKKIKQEVIIK